MAKRPARSRASTRLPKTLAGVITAIVLAAVAAPGVKPDWFHGKLSAPPRARPPAARTAPPPGDLPHTPSTFTAAKRALYEQVYADRRVTFYCGCPVPAPTRAEVDLAGSRLEALVGCRKSFDRYRWLPYSGVNRRKPHGP